jgi:phosphoesterase RecJ-like protein
MEAGADKDAIFARIEQNSSKSRMDMQGRALMSLRLVEDDSIALMRLTPEDFAAAGARPESLAGIVNMPMEIGSVRASILLVEFEPGLTKVSFRSKPATEDVSLVDVNELASRFGGGGHVHAAGARISSSLDDAEKELLAGIA